MRVLGIDACRGKRLAIARDGRHEGAQFGPDAARLVAAWPDVPAAGRRGLPLPMLAAGAASMLVMGAMGAEVVSGAAAQPSSVRCGACGAEKIDIALPRTTSTRGSFNARGVVVDSGTAYASVPSYSSGRRVPIRITLVGRRGVIVITGKRLRVYAFTWTTAGSASTGAYRGVQGGGEGVGTAALGVTLYGVMNLDHVKP